MFERADRNMKKILITAILSLFCLGIGFTSFIVNDITHITSWYTDYGKQVVHFEKQEKDHHRKYVHDTKDGRDHKEQLKQEPSDDFMKEKKSFEQQDNSNSAPLHTTAADDGN
jgi:hypothetical protein